MLTLNSAVCLETPKAQGATKATIPVDVTTGNQQATREEIGWLAGIIDGEGYMGFNVTNDRRRSRASVLITPCLHISNTDEAIILKAQAIMRKLGVNPYIRATKANSKIRKDQYRLQTKHMAKMKVILGAVRDHLTGNKQQRADLILEFIQLRQSTPWIWVRPDNRTGQAGALKPYSEREWQLYEACRAIQTRGASETIRRAQRKTSEIWKLMESRQLGSCEDIVRSHAKA